MKKDETKLKSYNEVIILPNINVIYALIDPNTNIIRYIGKTENLLKRIKKHYKSSELKIKTHKNIWINSLLKKEQRPNVLILEECKSVEELNHAEIKWISYYKSIGLDLVNGTEGGDGGKMSRESINKMILKKRVKNYQKNIKIKYQIEIKVV